MWIYIICIGQCVDLLYMALMWKHLICNIINQNTYMLDKTKIKKLYVAFLDYYNKVTYHISDVFSFVWIYIICIGHYVDL